MYGRAGRAARELAYRGGGYEIAGAPQPEALMSNATLTITGMSCGHCVAAVSNALKAVDGVTVEDVRIGSATLAFDAAKVTPAQLAQVVTDEGYAATVAG